MYPSRDFQLHDITSGNVLWGQVLLQLKGLDGGGGWVGAPKGCTWHGFVWVDLSKQVISSCRASISSIQGLFFSYGRLVFLERLN